MRVLREVLGYGLVPGCGLPLLGEGVEDKLHLLDQSSSDNDVAAIEMTGQRFAIQDLAVEIGIAQRLPFVGTWGAAISSLKVLFEACLGFGGELDLVWRWRAQRAVGEEQERAEQEELQQRRAQERHGAGFEN